MDITAPRYLTKQELQSLSRLDGWRFALSVALELMTIALAVWVSEAFRQPLLYALAVLVIGARMHALSILMHETAHYRACASRRMNDIVGEFLAWPLTITMRGYRAHHLAHHRALNTDDDPDWRRKQGVSDFQFPKTRSGLAGMLLAHASGLRLPALLRDTRKMKSGEGFPLGFRLLRLAFFVVFIGSALLLGAGKGLVLYWLAPLFTSFLFFMQIRSVSEHFAIGYDHALRQSRTVLAPAWERWLFAPCGVNYHLEHHLYPSIPFYRLADAHRLLMRHDAYRQNAHLTHGYRTGLLRECLGRQVAF